MDRMHIDAILDCLINMMLRGSEVERATPVLGIIVTISVCGAVGREARDRQKIRTGTRHDDVSPRFS